jgi:hypothetical protein
MMKKILSIVLMLAMALTAFSSLAVADYPYMDYDCCWEEDDYENVITKAVIADCPDGDDDDDDDSSGGSAPGGDGDTATNPAPIIKCKWEYDMNVYIDYVDPCECDCTCYMHDACPCAEGLQVKPIIGSQVMVGYYAIVTDPSGVADIEKVYADVWHPDCTFKYQIELELVGMVEGVYSESQALYEWGHVLDHHEDLITLNEDWMMDMGFETDSDAYDDIEDELNEELAYLYHGVAPIDYCQPGGWYYVGVKARDAFKWSDYLYNQFWYIPTSAIEIDFDTVDYGTLNLDTYKRVGGDDDMNTPSKPTVKNIGNTPVQLYVKQDDMGFGRTMIGGVWEWNVLFDARMTADPTPVEYEPEEGYVLIPGGPLGLCTQDKLDFGITVFKGYCGIDYQGTLDLKASIDMSLYEWQTPSQFIEPAPEGVDDIFEFCECVEC